MAIAVAVGSTLYVATRPVAVVVGKHVQYVQPSSDLVLIPAGLVGLFGAYAYLATYRSTLPMFGRASARSTDCSVSALSEYVPNGEVPRGPQRFFGVTYLYIAVENSGDTANFAANFSNVSGLIRQGDSYPLTDYFGKVAWEDTKDDRQTLGPGGKAKLMAMLFFTDPRACWFQIPYSSSWSGDQERQLAGWVLAPITPESTNVSFDLQVINETKKTSKTERVEIEWKSDGTLGAWAITSRVAAARETRLKIPVQKEPRHQLP